LQSGVVGEAEVFVERWFEAAAPLVFDAWTDPELVSRWPPDGYVIPADTVVIERRVGGRYEYSLVEVDGEGAVFPLRARIVRLEAPELLVLESEPMPDQDRPEPFLTTVRLASHDRRTRMRLYRPYPPERRAFARASWNSAFDRLDILLRDLLEEDSLLGRGDLAVAEGEQAHDHEGGG
jgi:uncharacterized protein YndB with AHSA1/START domain